MPFITVTYPPKYPLTASEKKWLKKRQDKGEYNFYYCQYCNKIPSIVTGGLCAGPCPMYPGGFEYEDCAEFEARVATKIAETAGDIALLLKQAGLEQLSDWQLLRITRLAVEEEMEGCTK